MKCGLCGYLVKISSNFCSLLFLFFFFKCSFLKGRLIWKSCKELLALGFLMEEVYVQRFGR